MYCIGYNPYYVYIYTLTDLNKVMYSKTLAVLTKTAIIIVIDVGIES